MTPITRQARRDLIATRLAAAEANQTSDRRSLKWRGQDVSWPEVQIPVDHALLNPHSHRIKPQVQSVASRRQVLSDDPFSEEAQEIIAEIIRNTPGYARIKAELARDGQAEPGMMTHEGVLINANTRLVALRELKFGHIKVQVMPPDASPAELTELELSFQMRRDVKQDYSFTAQLLFVRDLIDASWSPESIGLAMDRSLDESREAHRKQARQKVEADDRVLNLIEEIIERSSGNLTYEFFDDKQQALSEIDAAYQGQKEKDESLALREREAKVAGMLAGLDYRRVRQIDDTYLKDYLLPALDEEEILAGHVATLTSRTQDSADVDGLSGLDVLDDIDVGSPTDVSEISLEPIINALTATADDEDVVFKGGAGDEELRIPKKSFAASINRAFQTAADIKDRDSRGQNLLSSPMRHLDNAARECDRVIGALKEISGGGRLDVHKLRRTYEDYLRSHDELAITLERIGVIEPGADKS
ncbi:hypothetical protein [Amycolatopsis sp. NPDC051128]|uniref:hypothetical protein n=1 Tax=Amycolatopsis sp. NPDC051128 TaxID=3155412 RepID=UPI00342BC32A